MIKIKNLITGEVAYIQVWEEVPDGWIVVFGVTVEEPVQKDNQFMWIIILLIILYMLWR